MAASKVFSSLPSHIQSRIDIAFDSFASSIANDAPPGSESHGGFIVEHETEIKILELSLVSRALEDIGLTPDDSDVLDIFRNAASGWEDGGQQRGISLDDWRSVCGVLLEHHSQEYADSSDGDHGEEQDADMSDEYHDEDKDVDENEDDDDDVDEYTENRVTSRRLRGSGRRSTDPGHSSISRQQKQSCLDTFQLFFPETLGHDDLIARKIMIKDIQRIAGLLQEKIKAEEMVEMLQLFTASLDNSMSFQDFQQMMVTCRLL